MIVVDQPLNPYASPAAPPEPALARAPSAGDYRPLFGLVTAVTVAMVFQCLIEVVFVAQALSLVSVMNRVMADEEISDEALEAIDDRGVLIAILMVVSALATMVVWCVFTYRASRNAHGFGRVPMNVTPGWAVGYYFVPILTLWKPYQALKEIWQASEPIGDLRLNPRYLVETPGLFPAWWAAFILCNIAARVSSRMEPNPAELQSFLHSAYADIVSAVATFVAAGLAIALARALAKRQDACQKTVAAARAAVAAVAPVG
jgi:hypothetical protein